MLRTVMPELLDELPPEDPRAVHSRRDLRLVNRLMGNADIMARVISKARARSSADPCSIIELGGGDGTFLLELARRAAPALGPARAILVDQQSLVTPSTRSALEALSWPVEMVRGDVFDWLEHRSAIRADVIIANLFLHHFDNHRLSSLLRLSAQRTRLFAACEPRRSHGALGAASLMGVIGCNRVTVHDARVSVRAGFRDGELSALWPRAGGWTLTDAKAGRFTHGFVASAAGSRG
jgi:Methyltransferase domain